MASLTKDKSGNHHIHFRFSGRQYHKSLKTEDEKTAQSTMGRIELTLRDLELGRLTLPSGADFWQFVQSDGKLESKLQVEKAMTLADLFKWYFDNQTEGAKGAKTLETEGVSLRASPSSPWKDEDARIHSGAGSPRGVHQSACPGIMAKKADRARDHRKGDRHLGDGLATSQQTGFDGDRDRRQK